MKDLEKIGREISKTIIVDNCPENFSLQSENGICILSWYDDPQDRALQDLTFPLLEISKKNVDDVRVALLQFKQQMISQLEAGVEEPILSLD